MKYKNMGKAVLFLSVTVLLFSYVYKVFSWKDTTGDYHSSMDALKATEDDLVDVLFLGSSHCYAGIDNAYLWEYYGIPSFSLAISGQDLVSSYHSLVEALKTQKPKVVCMELYYATLEGYGVQGNLYRNTLSYPWSYNGYEVINTIAGEEERMDILLKWPIIHTRYRELQRFDFQNAYDNYRGFFSDFVTTYVDGIWAYQGEESVPIDAKNEEYIRKIIELTQKEGIALCMFVTPYVVSKEDQMQYNYVQTIADEYGVPFFNMNRDDLYKEIGIDGTRDFRDQTHISRYGAEKISHFLAEYMLENYELQDRRGDERYYLWDEFLEVVRHDELNYQLKSLVYPQDYLNQLTCMSGYTVVISVMGDHQKDTYALKDCLYGLGIGEAFYEQGGTWILEDMTPVYYSEGAEEYFYHHDLQVSDLAVSGAEGKTSVVIDFVEYLRGDNGINVVVYDNVNQKLVDVIYFSAENEYVGVR